jgi:metallophosphoesterase (TIGR00282 family)
VKALFIGDIVGKPGRDIVHAALADLVSEAGVDFVIANGENAAGGSGITPSLARELLDGGIAVLTMGDHVWRRKQIASFMEESDRIVRPYNLPPRAAGKGLTFLEVDCGAVIAVGCLLGATFMKPIRPPFLVIDEMVAEASERTPNIFLDFHAEATSEKILMGWYQAGKVTAICGTHTHVQTADERILPGGTAYITDAGMTGPHDSVIGRSIEPVLEATLTGMHHTFDVASGDVHLKGVLIEFDPSTGRAQSIERVDVAG